MLRDFIIIDLNDEKKVQHREILYQQKYFFVMIKNGYHFGLKERKKEKG